MIYNNENYLEGVKAQKCFPQNCHFSESVYYVIESGEKDFNSIFQAVGIAELNSFVEGVELLEEAVDVKALQNSIVEWFKNQWARIKGMYDEFVKKIKESADNFKKNVHQKLESAGIKVEEFLKKVEFDPEKVYYKGYEFKEDLVSRFMTVSAQDICNDITQAAVKFDTDLNAGVKDAEEICKKTLDAAINRAKKNAVSKDDASLAEVKQAHIEKFRSEKKDHEYKGSWIKENLISIWKECIDFGTVKKSIKELYKNDEKAINAAIKSVKKLHKGATLRMTAGALKDVVSVYSVMSSAHMQVLQSKHQMNMSIVMKALVAGRAPKKEEKKEEAVNASAITVPSTNQTELIESLFAW